MRVSALAILLLISSNSLLASDQDIGPALTNKYVKSVLILRHPVKHNSQSYSTAGGLLSQDDEGPWTVYSPIEVNRIQFKRTKLRISGNRITYGYDSSRKELIALHQKHPDSIHIDIDLDFQLATLNQADTIINRVFADNPEELVPVLPDHWKPYFEKRNHHDAADSDANSASSNAGEITKKKIDPTQFATDKDDHLSDVIRIGTKGITPPRALVTPQPEYSESARRLRLQGVCVVHAIIDQEGRVRHPYLVRPIGGGLDEQVISIMQRWRFEPGTRDGKPVNVEMVLEVAFHLF